MWPQLISSIIPGLLDKLFPDPTKAAEAKLEFLRLQQTGQLAELQAQADAIKGQLAINVEEAKSQNWFVAGWRPAIGWICGVALAYEFLFRPIAVGFGVGAFPDLDMSDLNTILFGMLGLGALRTVEKVKGAA
jgi:hypothetical protein